jgi:hypothetical protein
MPMQKRRFLHALTSGPDPATLGSGSKTHSTAPDEQPRSLRQGDVDEHKTQPHVRVARYPLSPQGRPTPGVLRALSPRGRRLPRAPSSALTTPWEPRPPSSSSPSSAASATWPSGTARISSTRTSTARVGRRLLLIGRIGRDPEDIEEDQAEDDMLVLGGVHVVAQLVRGLPELGFEVEGGAGGLSGLRGRPGRDDRERRRWVGGWRLGGGRRVEIGRGARRPRLCGGRRGRRGRRPRRARAAGLW